MPWLTSLGLLLFMSVFIGAVAWVTRRGGEDFYRTLGRMPLEGEGAGNGRSTGGSEK